MNDLGREAVVEIGDAEQLLASGRAVVTVTPDVCPEVGEPLEVLIVRTRRVLFAVESRCPHARLPLAGGNVRGRSLRCAGHGRRFDLRTGTERSGRTPRRGCLRTFAVRITDGRLFLTLR